MHIATSNDCKCGYTDKMDSSYCDPRSNKFTGVEFNITLNGVYGGNYTYEKLMEFIGTYIDTKSPSLGEYVISEISPGRPGGKAIEMLRIKVEIDYERNVKLSYYESSMMNSQYVPLTIPNQVSTLQFLYGFIAGWAYSVIQQRY